MQIGLLGTGEGMQRFKVKELYILSLWVRRG